MFAWLKRLGLGAAALPLVAQSSSFQGTTRVVRVGDFRIELDLSGQVLRLSVPDWARQGSPPAATPLELKQSGSPFVSAALLAQKAKQFDDGLYAAVELAIQQGAGRFPGKRWLLETVARGLGNLPPGTQSSVPGILLGAGRLGGLNLITPPQLVPAVESAILRFQADQKRSKPVSFYTWSEDLRRIFLQDRMLQQELTGAPEIGALVGILRRSDAGAAYEAYLKLTSKLTNPAPADKPDLRSLLANSGPQPPRVPGQGLYFFPPSRAHETELVKRLFGNRPIPEGFNLAEQIISRLRAGSLDLQPGKDSGWYDLATWALEPLILTGKMPEAKRLKLDQGYVRQLEELFKGLLALTRETHIKNLEAPEAGAAPPEGPSVELQPEISVEPVYSYYLRRAAGYRFLRGVLENALGAGTLKKLHRMTPDGPLERDLDSDLREISGLFHGASVTVAQELGFTDEERARMESLEISRVPSLPPGARQELGSGNGPPADGALFRRWAERREQDPDLSRDARMMVPLFYDVVRRKTKVWVFLGWASEALEVSYDGRPPIKVLDRRGRPADAKLRIEFASRWYGLIYPVTAEVYVSKLLDRKEFQAHCDRYQSAEAILKHLNDDLSAQ